jgi:predicted enzyme related to lactoylglutathione lyase
MSEGAQLLVYPVKDLDTAKKLFTALLEVQPYVDSPYYTGYRVGDQEIGLDPNSQSRGPIAYWTADDIEARLQQLLDAGAQVEQPVKDVGGGRLIAQVRDAAGNIVGLMQAS